MATYDKFYRRLFANSRVAHDLITGFLLPAGNWEVELLDLISGFHVTDNDRIRVSDMIWKTRVRWLNDAGERQEELLYVLLEFQSRPDRYMALRVLVYAGLLLQELQGNQEFRERGLPDTLSAVIYNGRRRWTPPTVVSALLRRAIPYLHNDQLLHQYRLIDEAACVRDGPLPDDNLASALFTMEFPGTRENQLRVLRWLNGRLSGPEDARLRRDFGRLACWLWLLGLRGLRLELRHLLGGDLLQEALNMAELEGQTIWQRLEEQAREEGIAQFERGIEQGRAEGIEQGRAAGIEHGRAEGIEHGRAEGLEQGRAEGIEHGRAEGIEHGRAEGLEQGRAEGLEQGLVHGLRRLLRTQLEDRFVPPPLPGWVNERLDVATEQDILRWSRRLMAEGAVTLDQIFLS